MTISTRGLGVTAAGLMVATLMISTSVADSAKLELGKKVFLEASEPRCSLCHTLKDAQTDGQIGPVLDELKPTAERVKAAVINGIGVMPAFETLTEEQVDAVALYVSEVAGNSK